MVKDPLFNGARVNQTFWSDKVNIQQCIPSSSTINYLSVPNLPNQSINKCLTSANAIHISFPVGIGQI
jgi:hypothetical protein